MFSVSSGKMENACRSLQKPAARNRVHGRKDEGQASSSVPKVKDQTDVQSSNSRRDANSLCMGSKMQ